MKLEGLEGSVEIEGYVEYQLSTISKSSGISWFTLPPVKKTPDSRDGPRRLRHSPLLPSFSLILMFQVMFQAMRRTRTRAPFLHNHLGTNWYFSNPIFARVHHRQ